MNFQEQVRATIKRAKEEGLTLEVFGDEGLLLSTMRPFEGTDEEVKLVADWREAEREWFPSVFSYNLEGTRMWMEKHVHENPERIIFLLRDPEGTPWGHAGLSTFKWGEPLSCEIDAVVRGRKDVATGMMTPVVSRLLRWAKEDLLIPRIELRVFSENERAIRLYERTGFEHLHLIPLVFEEGEPISLWRECKEGEEPQRHFLLMRLRGSE